MKTEARILITGLNGLIGWHLYRVCSGGEGITYGTYAKGHEVFEDPQCFKVNLDDPAQVSRLVDQVNPHYIVHARAICDLDLCESMPSMAQKINVEGTRILLKVIQTLESLRKFVYISTDHVFCGEKGSYHEKDAPKPKHVYGHTKLQAEKLVTESDHPFLIIRPGLVIGESFQGNKGPRDFLFSRIRAGKPTHLFTDEWRTPIFAQDLASRIRDLMFSEKTGVFHLAGTSVINRYELGRKLAQDHGLGCEQIFPRLREEDTWAHIRPKNLSLGTLREGEDSR